MSPSIGITENGDLKVDVPRLIETRALVQANSGGGKSWALRRILETTAKEVQQIVIDPEGEFSTLREKFDCIVCAPHDADAIAHPRTAALLGRRLLETGVSAIVDIYDLKANERQAFVRLFLDALINAPKKLWRPCLVVIDEAHIFAPEKGHSESTGAVIDLATRGRKRGFSAILATQRLSKLHKDAAAEMLNKLIGRTGLDVDVKRAADELGMTSKEAMASLRDLDPGEFFAFGPALSKQVTKVKVGSVSTTHPKVGERFLSAPPAPSAKIRKVLAELADLPKEAEREAKTLAELQAENAMLKRELTRQSSHQSGISEAEALRRERVAAGAVMQKLVAQEAEYRPILKALTQIETILDGALRNAAEIRKKYSETPAKKPPSAQEIRPIAQIMAAVRQNSSGPSVQGLRSGAVRILKELAARAPAGYSRAQVGALTGFAPSGGTFNTYFGDLRRGGLIEERAGLVYATAAGIEGLGDQVPVAPKSHDEAMSQWRRALRSGAFRMLEVIVSAGPDGIPRAGIASAVGMEATGGTFNTYLGDLRRNGLIEELNGRAIACNILFPDWEGR